MALTREFRDTVMELCEDPDFRKGLIVGALESYIEGDIAVGNSLLKDYLNGTQAFADAAQTLGVLEPGLHRMLGPNGNATAKNLFRVFKYCLDREGVQSTEELLKRTA